jgi:hypothetical protein
LQQNRISWRRVVVALTLGLLLAGCRDSGLALGPSPAAASAHADSLLRALGGRFGPARAAAGYQDSRAKFSRSALIPSRIFDDPELWSIWEPEARVLDLAGRHTADGYLLGIRGAAPTPGYAGDYRRTMRLRQLDRGEYQWRIRDERAVGSVSPDDLAAALTVLLRAAQQTTGSAVRAQSRAMLPRSSARLGRLFTLDSLHLAPAPGGGTLVSLVTTMQPRNLQAEFPHFSRFLGRYATPTRFQLAVHDEQGARWWTASKAGDRMTLRLRIHDGRLAPLEGPPRRMPDRLRLRADLATRVRIFNVGVSDLVGELTLTRTPREKAFTARFRREPDWHLPLLVERLIRTPLRRPFDGRGALLSLAARDTGGRTLLVREYELAVQESAIVRWLGGLGSTTLSDFRQGAEQEYEQFTGEVVHALRDDLRALLR